VCRGELADCLAQNGVPGTFFINGMKLPGRQAMVDKVTGRGHLLANHTQHHLQLTKLSSANLLKEVADTDAIVAAEQPGGPFLIRAPFGAWNGTIAKSLRSARATPTIRRMPRSSSRCWSARSATSSRPPSASPVRLAG
jgi:peptidoglycan/xylan/chitin deacetylase (PgdA/CDA1 family)